MEFIIAKEILSKIQYDNSHWFGTDYNMNLYRGCCHGCIYCDSRSNCYNIIDFDRVRIKKDCIPILEKQLKSKRHSGVIQIGAMSDTYNPFEKKYEVTREALKLIDKYGFGIAIATKSDLILRDIDILKKINTHSPVIVKFSITCGDDNLSKVIEPNVCVSSKRFEAIKKLKDAGIGTYILFQETYHKESYEKLHPTGPKHNYAYHTEAMDRAMEGGIDDVGCGVLFGLEKYRYEFAGLLMHAEHLEAVHGVGPHTISVPRIRRADDIDPDAFSDGIDDNIFAKIVACIRVAVPYTGMIISTRESKACREKVLQLGVSQISGGSRTSVGGYVEPEEPDDLTSEQFDVEDKRSLDEVVHWLMDLGFIPSFCTACYREGRTGDRFMSLCKNEQIHNCCLPNALMTLKEYLMDYAAEDTKIAGEKVIAKELEHIPNEKVRGIVIERLKEIADGQRDFRF